MTDEELLTAFVRTADEQAFRTLVDRYIALAYSTARARVRDAHLAEDVVQRMFIVLARKARTIRPPALPAWIISTTLLVARDVEKARRRSERREAVAGAMTQQRAKSESQ